MVYAVNEEGRAMKIAILGGIVFLMSEALLILILLFNIRKRKETEASLREQSKGFQSERRFLSLMEQSPLAIVLYTPEGKISRVNLAWKKLWGVDDAGAADVIKTYNILDDDQLKDCGWADLIKRAFAGENVVLPAREYIGQQAVEELNIRGLKANSAWIQCHMNPFRNEKQEIEYIVITVVDVTALKKNEEESQRQWEALARISRILRMERLTGSIAHELNQPLAGILCNAQAGEIMIQDGKCDSGDMAEIMGEIADDAKRAGEVIRNLRELYREQKGEFKPFDINAIVDKTTKLFHSEFILQNIEYTSECTPSLLMVNGNEIQIQQVIVNLIINGNEAMSENARDDRRLYIATACDSNEIKVWVEDNGPGIDPDKADNIFKPFATWKTGGTGMGLAISNSIIQAHGGRMWADNKPGGGARVGFAIPVQDIKVSSHE